MHLTIDEEGFHLLRRHLVEMHGIGHLLGRESLTYHVSPVELVVLHIHLDDLAKELLTLVPDNGVVVHRHTRVLRVVDQ